MEDKLNIFRCCENDDVVSLYSIKCLKDNLNIRNKFEQTPLHICATYDSEHCLKFLIESGADVNIKDYKGRSPLHLAAKYESSKCLKLLIENGSLINDQTIKGKSVLHYIIPKNNEKCLVDLIKYGVNIHIKDINGNTPLHIECDSGGNYINILIAYGADITDINAQNIYGDTPLHNLARLDSLEYMKLLINYGADSTIKNNDGNTFIDLINFKKNNLLIEKHIEDLETLNIKEPCV